MLELEGIENIIFDLGGVVLNIDYQLTSKAFRSLGVNSFDDIYSQKKQSNLFDLFETGEISPADFLKELSYYLPNVQEKEIKRAWNAMLLDLPIHRVNLLRALKQKYRIFLLSNTNAIHEEAFLEIIQHSYGKNIFLELFEQVYLSHQIGLRKPDLECFSYVLESNDLNPKYTLFIDDSIQHIDGALNAGLRAYLLTSGTDISQLFPDKFQ